VTLTGDERTSSRRAKRRQVAGIVARSMPLGEYVTGALFFLPTLGAALGVAAILVRRQYPYLPALQRSLAFMVLATAAMVLANVAPAAMGILARPTVLVAALALLAGAWFVPAARSEGPDPQPAPARSGPISIAIAVAAVGAVLVYELGRLRVLANQPISDIDMLGFHLPGVARFIQTGTLWRVDQFEPGFATAQYPNNGDFLILSAILPWRALAFVRYVPLPFYAFTAIGTYALALELSAPRAAAATMAAAVTTVPALSLLALEGVPDAIALATLAAGLVFLLRHVRSKRRSELVLAGLALGLSLGTKWYGFTAVLVVAAVWVAARLISRPALHRLARDGGTLLGMSLLGGGFWLLRNVIESANPIYPKAVSLFGAQLFAGSRNDVVDQYGYTIADYLGKPHILRTYIYPGFKMRVGLTGAVLLVGLLVAAGAAVIALRRRSRPQATPPLVLALAIGTLGMAALYAITPGSAYGTKNLPVEGFVNIRWLMPAIMIAAALGARAVVALGPAGVLLELAGLAGALDGIRLGGPVAGSTIAKVILVLAALIAAALLVRRWGRARGRAGPLRAAAIAVAVAACAAATVLARLEQRSFDRHPYASYDPTFAWIDAHAPAHRRIGITGVASTEGLSPVLPAFGPRLGNQVAYVGDGVRHSVHLPSRESTFDAELRRGRYDLLLIGLQLTGDTDAWARAAGYRLVAQSARLALYAAPT
jgi:hypothetical protein